MAGSDAYVRWLADLGVEDLGQVGGKNASLGEMMRHLRDAGIRPRPAGSRAIVYRENHGFDHLKVALSVGVQRMVRSDKGAAGVMFSIDTETGFPRTVLISAAWGLGETVVQGTIDPDEYVVFKPLLADERLVPIIHRRIGRKERKLTYARRGVRPTRLVRTSRRQKETPALADPEILQLARWAVAVEEHYGRPMDMEWAKDGETGEISLVQARPETVQSRKEAGALQTYVVKQKGERLLTGLAIGEAVAAGKVCRLRKAAEIRKFEDGAILVTTMTDPDWVPIMKRAAAIVTEVMGLTNVLVMIPFCRTLDEADRTLAVMVEHGLARATNGLEIYVMCEVPSNVILAPEFAERFDGFSIGSNDLTQLTLGVDRDSARLAALFDEENEAVRRLILAVIRDAHARGRTVGLCGQAPSDRPRFARFLVEAGIDSISVTPDSFVRVKQQVAAAEADR